MSLTSAEKVFIERMAFYVAKGYSFEEAGKAVLADDSKIFNFTFDETVESKKSKKALCADVYYSVKKDTAIDVALRDDTSGLVNEEIRDMVLNNSSIV